MFTDSIEGNLAVIEELLQEIPIGRRREASRAASHIENAFTRLQAESPKNNAVALGAAWAVYKLAQRLVEKAKEKPNGGLILPGS